MVTVNGEGDSTDSSIGVLADKLPDGAPAEVGPYRLVGVLGQGGMATATAAKGSGPKERN